MVPPLLGPQRELPGGFRTVLAYPPFPAAASAQAEDQRNVIAWPALAVPSEGEVSEGELPRRAGAAAKAAPPTARAAEEDAGDNELSDGELPDAAPSDFSEGEVRP